MDADSAGNPAPLAGQDGALQGGSLILIGWLIGVQVAVGGRSNEYCTFYRS